MCVLHRSERQVCMTFCQNPPQKTAICSNLDKTCKTTGMETLCPRNYVHIILICFKKI